jgi:hypothetical protein
VRQAGLYKPEIEPVLRDQARLQDIAMANRSDDEFRLGGLARAVFSCNGTAVIDFSIEAL